MIEKLTRQCEHPGCKITRDYYPRDIQRGKGLFCSSVCANEHRHDTTYWYICDQCGHQFKTIDCNKRHCSIQCEEISKLNESNESTELAESNGSYPIF